MESQTEQVLARLGITANYKGFHHTTAAVALALEQPETLLAVTKQLYPEVARQYHTNWRAVERNIRSTAALAWERNPELLQAVLRCPLTGRPRAALFIAALAQWVRTAA